MTEEVLRFDKARKRLKASPKDNDLIKAYLQIAAVMEIRVSQSQSNTKQQLKNIEQQYFSSHGKLPTSREILKDPAAKLLIDKLKHCQALVDQWKKENK
jgi:cob(I)alamin adenosyltransferase